MVKVDFLLESGYVQRYHKEPTVRPQTVAEHSFGVAMLVQCISEDAGYPLCITMIEALFHDVAEYNTGDIPFTVKRDNPDVKLKFDYLEDEVRTLLGICPPEELKEREHAILKVCDTLEGLIWCFKWERDPKPVYRTWLEAYARAQSKFDKLLLAAEWRRANDIHDRYFIA